MRKRFVGSSLLITFIVGLVTYISWLINSQAINSFGLEVARQRGEALYGLLQTVRSWSDSNPIYQRLPSATEDHASTEQGPEVSGTAFSRVNSAHLTKEISTRYAGEDLGVIFTSLILTNPQNAPDSWTAQVLHTFETADRAVPVVEKVGHQYRYLAPLFIEQSCLQCHSHQGYESGDIRGGIGFIFPEQEIYKLLTPQYQSNTEKHLGWGMVLLISAIAVYSLVFWLKVRLSSEVLKKRTLIKEVETDGLTGLLARPALLDRLHYSTARSSRYQTPLSLIIYDLDHFKKVNDTYGHLAGDEVLRRVTSIITAELREIDYHGRYGGEEFIVILPDTEVALAAQVAERLRLAVANAEIDIGADNGQLITATISAGVAEFPNHRSTKDNMLIELADIELYKAKRKGRNCISVLDPATILKAS